MLKSSPCTAWSIALPAGLLALAAVFLVVTSHVAAFAGPGCGSEEGCAFTLLVILTIVVFVVLPLAIGTVGVLLLKTARRRREPASRLGALSWVVNALLLLEGSVVFMMVAIR